jgi:hypothetical protein
MRLMTFDAGEKVPTRILIDPIRILEISRKTLAERRNGRLGQLKHDASSYVFMRISQHETNLRILWHKVTSLTIKVSSCRSRDELRHSYKMTTADRTLNSIGKCHRDPTKIEYVSLVSPTETLTPGALVPNPWQKTFELVHDYKEARCWDVHFSCGYLVASEIEVDSNEHLSYSTTTCYAS